MKRFIFILVIVQCSLSLPAESRLRGLVKLKSSGSKPLVGVQISAFGANAAYTNELGQFELIFPNKEVGDAVTLIIQKTGFELINEREISKVVLRNNLDDPVTIVMSKEGERDRQALAYYNIITENINQTFETDLKKIQIELEHIRDNQKKRNQLQAELDQLKEDRHNLLNQVETLAKELAKIDLDQVSQLTLQALEEVDQGNIQAALNLLSNEYLEQEWVKIRSQEQRLTLAKHRTIQAYLMKARLQSSLGKFKEAYQTYHEAFRKDSTNYSTNMALGKFLSGRHQNERALQHFTLAEQFTVHLNEKASAWEHLANEYRYLAKPDEAKGCYLKAQALYQAAYKEEPILFYLVELAKTKANLALLCEDQLAYQEGIGLLDEAIEIFSKSVEQGAYYAQVFLVQAYQKKSAAFRLIRNYQSAEDAILLALAAAQKGKTEDTTHYLIALGDIYNDKGILELDQGRWETAETSLLRAATIYNRLLAKDQVKYFNKIRLVKNNLGVLYSKWGKKEDSYSFLQQSLDMTARLYEVSPLRFRPMYAEGLLNLGVAAYDLEKYTDAESTLKKSIKIYRLLSELHPNIYEVDLQKALSNLGILYVKTEAIEKATLVFQEAERLLYQQIKQKPGLYEVDLALLEINLAVLYAQLKQVQKALAATHQALEIILHKYEEAPDVYRETLAKICLNLGLLYYDAQQYQSAINNFEKADLHFTTLITEQASLYQNLLGEIKDLLTLSYLFINDLTKAEIKNKEALSLLPENPTVLAHTGHILLFLGEWEEAKRVYLKNIDVPHDKSGHDLTAKLIEELKAFQNRGVKNRLLKKAIRFLNQQN